MPDNSEIAQLYRMLSGIPTDRRPNVAILTNEEFLFCYKDNLSRMEFMRGYGPVEGLGFKRGDIINFFTQIELIINQIILVHLKAQDGIVLKFGQLLDCVDLFSKIKLLKDWDIIDRGTKADLICLKEVRNGFAHNWELKKVKYRGDSITQNFETFKSDSQRIFTKMLELYNGGPIDLTQLIADLRGAEPIANE